MKIRILSDLHLEFHDWVPPKCEADVVILAGDIHVGINGIEWARRSFPLLPVLYIPGNHEFYGGNLQHLTEELYVRGRRLGVDVLDGRMVVIGGVRFLGATLWTDFALYGSDQRSIDRAMTAARFGMSDFHYIRHENRTFQPEDARAINLKCVEWLRAKLADEFHGATVVVTHHLPLRQSIHARYAASELNPSFASDLSNLLGPSVSLWIHGHTHESFDYSVNGTRIVCNPRGYLPKEPNAGFDPLLTIDIPSPGFLKPIRRRIEPLGGAERPIASRESMRDPLDLG
jgi:predicted phosphodiesterase